MVVALEPEEGKAKFYHEVCYCFTKIIVPFFFFFFLQKIESHWWEKAMATHSSALDWKIPWTEEPGRLQSMGSIRVRQD